MSISKKRAPTVDDSQLNRIITTLYDDINEVINAVNQDSLSTNTKGYSGKEGDLRLVKESDGSYEIQGKTKEGWTSTAMNFKDKKLVKNQIEILVDSSGGTANNAIEVISSTPTQAQVRNNFADLTSKINEVLSILKTVGILKK